MLRLFDLVGEHGPQLGEPHSKPLSDGLFELRVKALENKDVKDVYNDLDAEFKLINQLIYMRKTAGLTQEEVANRMATKKSNICRLERFRSQPKISTIQKYAKACGFVFSFEFNTKSEIINKLSNQADNEVLD